LIWVAFGDFRQLYDGLRGQHLAMRMFRPLLGTARDGGGKADIGQRLFQFVRLPLCDFARNRSLGIAAVKEVRESV
jgi:hypothetical protein